MSGVYLSTRASNLLYHHFAQFRCSNHKEQREFIRHIIETEGIKSIAAIYGMGEMTLLNIVRWAGLPDKIVWQPKGSEVRHIDHCIKYLRERGYKISRV